jgi:hypothetical protein
VLGNADGLSSLAASMLKAVELLKGRIDAVTANGLRWGSHSVLVVVVSHQFPIRSEQGAARFGWQKHRGP